MKLLIATCLALSFLPLHADEWLQNGDFSDGLTHWYGDGQLASELAKNDDPLASSTAAAPQGVVVQLKPNRWSKLSQEFTTDTLKMSLTIKYTPSADCVFSDKADYYHNIFDSLGMGAYSPRSVPIGSWAVVMTDLGTGWCYYFSHPFDKAASGSQTFQANASAANDNMKPALHKTVTLAFPPGKGSVTVTYVSLKDQS